MASGDHLRGGAAVCDEEMVGYRSTHMLASSGEPRMNIFVGNLAFTTTEHDLRQLFAPYGTVDTVRMMTDRETGRSRGFGFVEMPDPRAAQRAIDALNGTSLAGRTLTVNEARPREPRREPRQPRW
jgi:RNA recognition motif-containing protein